MSSRLAASTSTVRAWVALSPKGYAANSVVPISANRRSWATTPDSSPKTHPTSSFHHPRKHVENAELHADRAAIDYAGRQGLAAALLAAAAPPPAAVPVMGGATETVRSTHPDRRHQPVPIRRLEQHPQRRQNRSRGQLAGANAQVSALRFRLADGREKCRCANVIDTHDVSTRFGCARLRLVA
jgi:hypothetical protein